jgi:hypothetical protein
VASTRGHKPTIYKGMTPQKGEPLVNASKPTSGIISGYLPNTKEYNFKKKKDVNNSREND